MHMYEELHVKLIPVSLKKGTSGSSIEHWTHAQYNQFRSVALRCESIGYLIVFGADFAELKGAADLHVELELLGVHLHVSLGNLVEQVVELPDCAPGRSGTGSCKWRVHASAAAALTVLGLGLGPER